MGIIKEDWERVHLMDQAYIKEMELEEMFYFSKEERDKRLPAVIRVVMPEFKPKEKV